MTKNSKKSETTSKSNATTQLVDLTTQTAPAESETNDFPAVPIPRELKVNSKKMTRGKVATMYALFQDGASVNTACQAVGISNRRFYELMERDSDFALVITRAREAIGDRAEEVVGTHVRNGHLTASQWYLERKRRTEYGKDTTQGPALALQVNVGYGKAPEDPSQA